MDFNHITVLKVDKVNDLSVSNYIREGRSKNSRSPSSQCPSSYFDQSTNYERKLLVAKLK